MPQALTPNEVWRVIEATSVRTRPHEPQYTAAYTTQVYDTQALTREWLMRRFEDEALREVTSRA